MAKIEIFVCNNGSNVGVPVEFPVGEETMTRDSPCQGCAWRTIIRFERKPEFEGIVDLTQYSQSQADAYFAYQDARQEAERQAKGGNGGVFSWERLEIDRYPNLNNAISCIAKFK